MARIANSRADSPDFRLYALNNRFNTPCQLFPATLKDLDELNGELQLFIYVYFSLFFISFPKQKVLHYIAHHSLIQVNTGCELILKAIRSGGR